MNALREAKHERHRRSIRLRGYDYSQSGAYFVTMCTRNREHLFGEIENGDMRLNNVGRMVDQWWHELGNRFPDIETDAFIVMPNHIHGIIVIKNIPVSNPVGAILCNRPVPIRNFTNPNSASSQQKNSNTGTNLRMDTVWEQCTCRRQGDYKESPLHTQKIQIQKIPNAYDGLGRYISWFKRMVINEYIRRVRTKEFPRFEKSIWQRNYYERIIRDDSEWRLACEYIEKNPNMWERDTLNTPTSK